MSANKKQAIACILSAAFFFAVMNLSVNQVSVILSRLRHRLKDDLIERGFDI